MKQGKATIICLMHFATDAIGVAYFYHRVFPHVVSGAFYALLIAYTIVAFCLQPFVGLLLDRIKRLDAFVLLSGSLMVLFAVLPTPPVVNALFLGLGNALFHVAGGMLSISKEPHRARFLGVFVAPGAVGLALGTAFSQFLVVYALFAALLCALFFFVSKEAKGEFQKFEGESCDLPALLIVLPAVFLRGFVGGYLPSGFFEGAFGGVLLAVVIALGKAFGGFPTDRFGAARTAVCSLVPAACLLLSGNVVLALFGTLLFHASMPMTLYLIVETVSKYRGFGFGIAAAALMLGSYCAFALPLSSSEGAVVTVIGTLVSVGLICGGEFRMKKLQGKTLLK